MHTDKIQTGIHSDTKIDAEEIHFFTHSRGKREMEIVAEYREGGNKRWGREKRRYTRFYLLGYH